MGNSTAKAVCRFSERCCSSVTQHVAEELDFRRKTGGTRLQLSPIELHIGRRLIITTRSRTVFHFDSAALVKAYDLDVNDVFVVVSELGRGTYGVVWEGKYRHEIEK